MNKFRTCGVCKIEFPLDNEYFYVQKANKLGFTSDCKKCRNLRVKKYYRDNKEDIVKRRHAQQEANKEHIIERDRKYQEANKDRKHKYDKEYYQQHKEHINKRKRERYRRDGAKDKEQRAKYRRKKYQSDPMFRLNLCISDGIRKSLCGNKNGRHWEDLVGYTLEEFKSNLESQFQDGMTWENHGYYGWHIDHIKPISLFNFTHVEDPEFKECWALSNLQPLWAGDNICKGDKYEEQAHE